MPKTLAWPITQVGYRLCRGSAVEPGLQVLSANNPHHFDIYDVRGNLIGIGGQARRDVRRPWRIRHDLE